MEIVQLVQEALAACDKYIKLAGYSFRVPEHNSEKRYQEALVWLDAIYKSDELAAVRAIYDLQAPELWAQYEYTGEEFPEKVMLDARIKKLTALIRKTRPELFKGRHQREGTNEGSNTGRPPRKLAKRDMEGEST